MRAAPLPVRYADAEVLRTDPRAANPPDWRVDWADGPWPVKVLDGGIRRPLDGPDLAALGRLLFHTFAVSRVRADPHGGLTATPARPVPSGHASPVLLRRPVPSGGSMYPTEVYAVGAGTPGSGAHHYDPYRHELTDLGLAGAPARLAAGLGVPDLPAVTLVLTNRFWKNFYKYGDFAYRLGAVDVGVALGRVLRLATPPWGPVRLWTAYDDERVEAALGLDGTSEAAYAVVGLAAPAPVPARPVPRPPAVLERSRRIRRSDRFDALHRAAREVRHAAPPRPAPVPTSPGIALPDPEPVEPGTADMLSRTCAGARFDGRPAIARALATVLHHTATALARPGAPDAARSQALYVAVHRVIGVDGGWYRYRPDRHDLAAVGHGRAGDTGRVLQEALFAASLNVELAAFTIHVSAPAVDSGAGLRGYRDQQLAVGLAVEASTLLAAAVGLSGHPVLGFDVARVDRAYGLAGGPHGTQVQVSVGSARPGLSWEVSVMPR